MALLARARGRLRLPNTRAGPVVSLSTDDDTRTPGPLRAMSGEPTQLTVAATAAGTQQPDGCVLAVRGQGLQAVGALGAATPESCQQGKLQLRDGSELTFVVE